MLLSGDELNFQTFKRETSAKQQEKREKLIVQWGQGGANGAEKRCGTAGKRLRATPTEVGGQQGKIDTMHGNRNSAASQSP